MIKRQFVTQKFGYPTSITDPDTGEIQELEMPKGACLKMQVPTENFVYTLENYVTFNPLVDEYLYFTLSATDYQRLHRMACWLETEFNMVSTGNHRPHTLKTMSIALGVKEDETRRMIKRLEKAGLVVWSPHVKSGRQDKIIMLNPHYVRKRTTFHESLFEIFPDLRKMVIPTISPKKILSKKQSAAA